MKQGILRVAYYMYNYPVHNGCSRDVGHSHCHQHRRYLEGLIYRGGSKREEYHHAERNREEGTFYRVKPESDSTSWQFLQLGTVDVQDHIILYCGGLPTHCQTFNIIHGLYTLDT